MGIWQKTLSYLGLDDEDYPGSDALDDGVAPQSRLNGRMKPSQLVALWTATVALVVIAVFTTLNYFDSEQVDAEEAHRVTEVAYGDSSDAWACTNAYIGVLATMPGWRSS